MTVISNKAIRTLGLLNRILFPCSQSVKFIAYKMFIRPQHEHANGVWNPYTRNVLRKLNKYKEIHSDSFFRNTIKILIPHISLTVQIYILFIHVGSINKHPCFTKFITALLTYILHLICNMLTISQADLITP